MKKLLLISLLTVAVNSSAQTVVFQQDFESSNSINAYINANSPNIGQFNGFNNGYLLSNQTAATISIVDNKLNFDKTAGTNQIGAFITRSTNFSVTPLVMKMECDVEVTSLTSGSNVAFRFEVGHDFPYTYNTTPGNTSVHSSFALRLPSPTIENPDDDLFYIRRITGSENSANSYKGKQRVVWVVNNSGADFTYTAPNGTERTVGNDKHDIWVGTALVFGNSDCVRATPDLKNIRITFAAGNANVALDKIKITSLKDTPPLPVTLTSFTGKQQNETVLLNWSTASEQNNKSFTLSRSHDGKTFEEIAYLDGAGNSSTIKNYSYIDKNPYAGVNYYELQQEDFNGDRQEPKVIVVDSKIATAQLSVYHHAKGLAVNITSPNHTNGKIQLYNISGQRLYQQAVNLTKGINEFYLPAQKGNGLYFIRYVADGKVVHHKFKL